MFNFSIVRLAAQVNRKIESDIEFSGRRDQVTLRVYSRNKRYMCQNDGKIPGSCFRFSSVIKFDMCEFKSKVRISQLLRLTIVSAKSKIYSPRRGYLSPGNSMVLGNSSCFIVHQRHKFLPILGLILLKLKHASNRHVYFRDLCTRCGPIDTTDTLTTRQHSV